MSDTVSPAPPEGDKITLPQNFFRNIKHFLTILLGVGWMGFSFAFFAFIAFAFSMFYGEKVWHERAWDFIIIAANTGMILSMTAISITAIVRQLYYGVEKTFSGWMEETASLSLNQHVAVVMVVAACFMN